MRVCLMIEGQEGVTWDEWVALAGACERHGLDGLFRSDHYSAIVRPVAGSLDAWTTLAALAVVTKRIRLGTMVSPATFRHPSVLARQAVTVDHVSAGRIEVGMGAGWYEREHRENGFDFSDGRTRFARLAEQVEVVVRSWTEDDWSFAGEHYHLAGQTALPRPLQLPHPPLILGGTAKPRAAALAARWASEYNTAFATPEECAARKATLVDACATAGRDPTTLPLSLMTLCVVGEDSGEARDRMARVVELRGDRTPVDDLLDATHDAWLVGTVEQVIERLDVYRAAGIERVYLQHLDHTDLGMVETIGRSLAPALA
jgi:F420-dependent oxidoreductase-like protein